MNLVLLVVALLASGCGADKAVTPKSDVAVVTVGQYTLPESGVFRDVSKGDPTSDDAAVYGRYHISKVSKIIYYEAPSGALIAIDYQCGFMGPLPAGHGMICSNPNGGYDVYYSDPTDGF